MQKRRKLVLDHLWIEDGRLRVSELEIKRQAGMSFEEFASWLACHHAVWERYECSA